MTTSTKTEELVASKATTGKLTIMKEVAKKAQEAAKETKK
jgi:hypothetical protein